MCIATIRGRRRVYIYMLSHNKSHEAGACLLLCLFCLCSSLFVCLFDLLWGFLRKEITRVVRFRGR